MFPLHYRIPAASECDSSALRGHEGMDEGNGWVTHQGSGLQYCHLRISKRDGKQPFVHERGGCFVTIPIIPEAA